MASTLNVPLENCTKATINSNKTSGKFPAKNELLKKGFYKMDSRVVNPYL